MSQFPAQTPHVIANRIAAASSDDNGALYIVRPDEGRVIVTVRSQGKNDESSVSVPIEIFRKMVADYAAAPEPYPPPGLPG